MESLKPVVDQETILSLLRESFQQPIRELNSVQGGMIAQTLSFQVNDKEYILRFKPEAGYKKEAFIYQRFASATIPVAPILKIGRFGNLFYAI